MITRTSQERQRALKDAHEILFSISRQLWKQAYEKEDEKALAGYLKIREARKRVFRRIQGAMA